jgi:hypothetical protein
MGHMNFPWASIEYSVYDAETEAPLAVVVCTSILVVRT